jgi:nucleoside-diphosphate-sugar epimerase
MVVGLSPHFALKLLDVQSVEPSATVEGKFESRVGDVSKLEDALWLCDGCTDLIIGHMAPNRPEIYGTPEIPFDVNVKGTAQLFHAAVEKGVRRVVLISSISVVQTHLMNGVFLTADLPPTPVSPYALTKTLQEEVAAYYHRTKGLEIAVLRPALICDEDTVADKYGNSRPTVNWQFIDPRDIAEAARLALQIPHLGYQIFYPLGHPEAEKRADVAHLRKYLGWQPQHPFTKYPYDGEVPGT